MGRLHIGPVVLSVVGSLLLGCGGGDQPPAESPAPPADAAQPAAGQDGSTPVKSDEEQAADSATGASPADVEPKAPEVYKPDRPPRDILTTEDTSFELSFSASQIGEETAQQCEAQFSDDPKGRSECRRKVQDKVGSTVQRFIEQHGSWWWITYLRKGNQLVAIHRIAIEWGEQTDNTVELKPMGKDQGASPMSPVPRSVVVTIPNSYSIEMQDKQWGRMQYSTKIGLFPKK